MSVFEKKKVFIKFLFKDKSYPKKHPLYGGKHEKASVTITAPHFENKPIKIFSVEELAELTLAAQEDLKFNKDNDFWRSGITQFAIPNDGITLDLTKWIDVIRHRIACHDNYKDLIGKGTNYSPICKYAIFDSEEESDAVKATDARFDNIKFYGKFENDIRILRYVYWAVNGSRLALTEKLSKVQNRVKETMELELTKFNRTVKAPNLEEKGLLLEAVLAGVVEKTKVGYKFNSKNLYKGNQGTFDSAAEFLTDKLNQATKFDIESKLE